MPRQTDRRLLYYDDKKFREDAFYALYARELEKPDAVWHTLTAEIVDNVLNAAASPGSGEEQEPDSGHPAPAATEAEAQAFWLYREYLAGKRAAQVVCITYNEHKREASYLENTFQPPDVYEADLEQGIIWRVTDFTLLDLDGDGVRELILSTSNGGVGNYEIFHCWNGQMFDNEQWERAFCNLQADGTFTGSGGADSHSIYRACFQEGVMEKAESAWSNWGEYHGADGASISEAEWDVLWDAQNSKVVRLHGGKRQRRAGGVATGPVGLRRFKRGPKIPPRSGWHFIARGMRNGVRTRYRQGFSRILVFPAADCYNKNGCKGGGSAAVRKRKLCVTKLKIREICL